jgi:pyrroline-5-carboxylate reductase
MGKHTKSITIIGLGRIGLVIGQRLAANQYQVRGYDTRPEALEEAHRLGIETTASAAEAVLGADTVLLALPPAAVQSVVSDIRQVLQQRQIILSLAGAVPLSYIEGLAGEGIAVMRIMPNTPSLIGQGMNPVCYGKYVSGQAKEAVDELLTVLGDSVVVADEQMNWCTGLTGAAPRYVFAVIEALAEAGVEAGLDRAKAVRMAAQVVAGSGLAVLQSGLDIEELKALTPLQPLDEDAAIPLFREAVETARTKMDEAWAGISSAA